MRAVSILAAVLAVAAVVHATPTPEKCAACKAVFSLIDQVITGNKTADEAG